MKTFVWKVTSPKKLSDPLLIVVFIFFTKNKLLEKTTFFGAKSITDCLLDRCCFVIQIQSQQDSRYNTEKDYNQLSCPVGEKMSSALSNETEKDVLPWLKLAEDLRLLNLDVEVRALFDAKTVIDVLFVSFNIPHYS